MLQFLTFLCLSLLSFTPSAVAEGTEDQAKSCITPNSQGHLKSRLTAKLRELGASVWTNRSKKECAAEIAVVWWVIGQIMINSIKPKRPVAQFCTKQETPSQYVRHIPHKLFIPLLAPIFVPAAWMFPGICK